MTVKEIVDRKEEDARKKLKRLLKCDEGTCGYPINSRDATILASYKRNLNSVLRAAPT